MTDSRCFDADLLGIIKRNFRGLRQDTFIMLYKFLVRSHLEYATTFGSILFAWELQKCGTAYLPLSLLPLLSTHLTRKPSYRWRTRATRKSAKNCSNSTCLQRCRWQYLPIFIRLAVVASEICEIPQNSLKIQTYGVQGHPRSSILVSIESPCTTSY